jgi:iron(III) transport system substrate-binding protein
MRLTLRSAAAGILASLTILLASGHGASAQSTKPGFVEPKNLQELIEAARKEHDLTIAWATSVYGGADGIKQLQDHINKKWNVNIAIKFTPSIAGAVFRNQVIQEVKAGQTSSSDIVFALYQGQASGVDVAQYFQPVDWRKYVPIPEDIMFFNKRAVAVITQLEGVIYNTKLVPPDKVPHSLNDLLKPEWKGKIATPPYEGDSASYLGLPEALGHEKMLAYFRQFTKQVGGLVRCGSSDRVVSGEFAMYGIDCGDYEARLKQRAGQPIAEAYPREGTDISYMAPAIPNTAEHPYTARLLLAYMLSREGQDVLWDVMATDNWKIKGSHMGGVISDLRKSGVKMIESFGRDSETPTYVQEIDDIVSSAK